MTPLGGIAFLLVGIAIFALGIAIIVIRERRRRRPKSTVEHFTRSRLALGKVYRRELAVREARRQRARDAHPSAHPPGRADARKGSSRRRSA